MRSGIAARARTRTLAAGSDRRVLAGGLVAVHVAVALVLLLDPGLRSAEYAARSDAARFYEIATHHGVPYVDFAVEYPPLLVLAARAAAVGSFGAFVATVVVVSLAADLLLAALLRRVWGARAGVAYLVLAAPLLPVVLTRLDVVATALAVLACALALDPKHQRAAGAVLAVAVFAKLWPAALAILWVARRRWRALAACVGVGAAGAAAWVAQSGLDGVRQVATYRGARGWQVESLPGTVLAAFGGRPPRFESGAWRVGQPPALVGLLWPLAGLAGVGAVGWVLARSGNRRPFRDDAGTPALAVVGVVLVTATLLSPQFLVWLVPWAAVAFAADERRAPALLLGAIVVTVAAGALWPPEESGTAGAQGLYWLRNALLVATAVAAGLDTRRGALSRADPDRALGVAVDTIPVRGGVELRGERA